MPFPGYINPVGTNRAVLIDAGVLYHGATPVGFGVTRGGLRFDPGIERRDVPFDGKSSGIATLDDRVVRYNSTISGRMLIGTLAQIANLEPGSTLVPIAGETPGTLTPMDARTALVAGDYLEDVTFIGQRTDGKVGRVVFPVAIVTSYTLATEDPGEGLFDVTITARLAADETNLNACPYYWEEV